MPTRVGKKKKKTKGPDAASKLPLGNDVVPVPRGAVSVFSLGAECGQTGSSVWLKLPACDCVWHSLGWNKSCILVLTVYRGYNCVSLQESPLISFK